MTTDAYIRVVCDECGDEEEIQLTCTAKGYDDRNVERDIERMGWVVVGEDTHHCADCATKDEDEDAD